MLMKCLKQKGSIMRGVYLRTVAFLLVALSRAAMAATVTMTPGDNLSSLADVAHDTTVVFPAGDYHLTGEVGVYNRRNLTLRGEPGARIVRAFDPTNPGAKVVLVLQGCENLTIEGFTVTTDQPVNTFGTVVSKSTKSFVVDVDAACPMTGREKFASIDSYDANGMPDYRLAVMEDVSYSVQSGRRITVSHAPGNLTVGQRVCFRNAIYIDQTFYLVNDRNIVFRDIEVERAPSMAITLQPGCENATFERFNVRLKSGDNSCYAANADAIHIVNLAGRLTLSDCHFNGLGDDALNLHTIACRVKTWNAGNGTMTVASRESYQPGANWCKAGSVLTFYGSNMKRKGGATVSAYSFADGVGTMTLSSVDGAVAAGDFVDVESARASVRISECSVQNTRARGFLLQSKDMQVENCSFSQLALPGLLIAPSVDDWYEMGPSSRVTVRNCTFSKCCTRSGYSANTGALSVKVGHDSSGGGYSAGVHRDFAVYGNTFADCSPRGLYLDSVDGAYVNGNAGDGLKTVNCANVGETFDEFVHSDGRLPVAADEPMTLDQPLGVDITKTGAGTLTLDLPAGSAGRVNLAEGEMIVKASSDGRVGTVTGGTLRFESATGGTTNFVVGLAGGVTVLQDKGKTLAVSASGSFAATAAKPVRIELSEPVAAVGSYAILSVPTMAGTVAGGSVSVVYETDVGLETALRTVTVGGVQTVSLEVTAKPHYTIADDSFESIDVGTTAGAIPGWTGSGFVNAQKVTMADPPTYPLNGATHEHTLCVEDEAVRTYENSFVRDNQSLDMLVEVRRPDSNVQLPDASDMSGERQVSVTVDANGWFNVWHPDASGTGHWTPLSFGTKSVFADGENVRLTLVFDYHSSADGAAFGQVRINGSCGVLWDDAAQVASDEGVRSPNAPTAKGSWFRLFSVARIAKKVSGLNVKGCTMVDDVVFRYHSPSVSPMFDMGTVMGVDYVGMRSSGYIPFSTFDDTWGLSRDPYGDADGDGFLNGEELLCGTNPLDPTSNPRTGFLMIVR